jgi:GDP-L-fucose synthase
MQRRDAAAAGGEMTADVRFALAGKRVWVAGHTGMVGSAMVRRLAGEDVEIVTRDRSQLDLRRQADVEAWMAAARPQVVVVAAARVGGILENDSYPAEFIYDNLLIAGNVLHAAHLNGVEKLLYLGSSCIYPKLAPQPMPESALLSGPLEPTNRAYAIAKIAGIGLAQSYRRQYGRDFICAAPTNLFGPGDNFELKSGHVLPALMRKAHEAKLAGAAALTVWGSGAPRREFLHVDDCADALVHLLKTYSDEEHVNVGSGSDLTIRELAQTVADVVGFAGALEFDAGKPDGAPRKLTDTGKLRGLGWAPTIALRDGVAQTYAWYLDHARP